MKKFDICANESITAKEFLLIDEHGISLGNMTKDKAFEVANEQNLDLVQVNSSPAVVRLLKLDKYIYQLNKAQKENKKKQSVSEIKTIVLKLRTGFNAKEVIKLKAKKFFQEGNKVTFTMKLKRKESNLIEEGEVIMKKLYEDLSSVASVIKELQRQKIGENFSLTMMLAKKKVESSSSNDQNTIQ